MLKLNESPVEILKLLINNGGTDIAKKVLRMLQGDIIVIDPCDIGSLKIYKSFMFKIGNGNIAVCMGEDGVFPDDNVVKTTISEGEIQDLRICIKNHIK